MKGLEINLEGNVYSGRFVIYKNSFTSMQHFGDGKDLHIEPQDHEMYFGEGIVGYPDCNNRQMFIVYPLGDKKSDLVIFEEGVVVRDYKKIVDLVLGQMRDDAKASIDAGEIIPKIRPRSLDIAVLREMGLVVV